MDGLLSLLPGLRRLTLAAYFVCLFVSMGCDLPGKPNPADKPVLESEIVDFDPLFQKNCVGCHGNDGKLGPAPLLNDPLFLTMVPDEELLKVITHGRSGTPMPAFAESAGGTLNEKQVKALASGLKAKWKADVALKLELPPYLAPTKEPAVASTETTERGMKLFARACAECHGTKGQGTPGIGAVHDPVFLGLISDQALRRIIITGRSDLGMPNFAETQGRGGKFQPLTSAEISDLVALLGVWRQEAPLQSSAAPTAPPGEGKQP